MHNRPGAAGYEAPPRGWRLVALDEADSTNDEVRRRIDGGEGAEGLVVVAARQTAGRGRRGREWASPQGGNLYASVCARRAAAGVMASAQLSFVTALALVDALKETAPHVSPRLKWPNDVLVNGGKLAGILLETNGQWVIAGTGVNLAVAPPAAPARLRPTSLKAEGAEVERMRFLFAYCHHLRDSLALWRERGFAPIRARWLALAQGLGGPIVARLHNGDEDRGTFAGLDAQGALMLETDDGGRRVIHSAEVFFA